MSELARPDGRPALDVDSQLKRGGVLRLELLDALGAATVMAGPAGKVQRGVGKKRTRVMTGVSELLLKNRGRSPCIVPGTLGRAMVLLLPVASSALKWPPFRVLAHGSSLEPNQGLHVTCSQNHNPNEKNDFERTQLIILVILSFALVFGTSKELSS